MTSAYQHHFQTRADTCEMLHEWQCEAVSGMRIEPPMLDRLTQGQGEIELHIAEHLLEVSEILGAP